jgi:D-glycero-D-manno-heptose 1,7-bisphosphate phosphatase
VTNQSGIDRGLFGWREFGAVQSRLDALLAADDARIDAVAACPFHPDFTAEYADAHARWRKPNSAMLTALADRMKLDAGRSWLVGDSARDIDAARAAGLVGAVQLLTEGQARPSACASGRFRVCLAADLAATETILRKAGLFNVDEQQRAG